MPDRARDQQTVSIHDQAGIPALVEEPYAAPARAPQRFDSLKLYGYWRSSATWRVRIALALKGLPFAYEPVALLKGEHTTPAYVGVVCMVCACVDRRFSRRF